MPDYAWLLLGIAIFVGAVPVGDRLERGLRKLDSLFNKKLGEKPASLGHVEEHADR